MSSRSKKSVKSKATETRHASALVVWTGVILITALAAAIRVHKLGAWSLWVDELFTLDDSIGKGSLGLYHGGTFPLSYILIGLSIHRFGISEWSMRIVPALFGVAAPAMIYLTARKSFGDMTSFMAALIIAVSPWHLYWSQMARFYTMTLFFSAAAVLVLHRGLELDKKGLVLLSSILLALGVLSHYSALLTMVAVAAYAIILVLFRWEKPRGFTLVNALIFLAPFIVGVIVIGSKAAVLLKRYAAGHPTGTVITQPAKAAVYMLFSTAYRVEATVTVLAVIAVVTGIAKRDRGMLLITCAAAIPMALLTIIAMKSHAENRYAFVILPFVALLAGRAISMMSKRLWETSRVLAVAIPVIIALPMLQHDISYFGSLSNGERWDYRAAADYLKTHANEGDLVYSSMPKPIEHYLQDTKLKVVDLNVGEKLPESRTWLVMEDSTRGESTSKDLAGWVKDNCVLTAHFSASSPMTDYGLSVYRRK